MSGRTPTRFLSDSYDNVIGSPRMKSHGPKLSYFLSDKTGRILGIPTRKKGGNYKKIIPIDISTLKCCDCIRKKTCMIEIYCKPKMKFWSDGKS